MLPYCNFWWKLDYPQTNRQMSVGKGPQGELILTEREVMCCEFSETAQLAWGKGGGRSQQLVIVHIFQDDSIKPPPTGINHAHTDSVFHQSVCGSDCHTVSTMPLSLHMLLYSPLQSFWENEDTEVLLEFAWFIDHFTHKTFYFKWCSSFFFFFFSCDINFHSQQLKSGSKLAEEYEIELSTDICWLLGTPNQYSHENILHFNVVMKQRVRVKITEQFQILLALTQWSTTNREVVVQTLWRWES